MDHVIDIRYKGFRKILYSKGPFDDRYLENEEVTDTGSSAVGTDLHPKPEVMTSTPDPTSLFGDLDGPIHILNKKKEKTQSRCIQY